jgi:large subunit ribosomal protein L23
MSIIIKPLVTEKITTAGEKFNRYGFLVDPKADKALIRTAIQSSYGVEVTKVHTMNYIGKKVTRYTKKNVLKGRKNAFKKAVVTLKEGQNIDLFANI